MHMQLNELDISMMHLQEYGLILNEKIAKGEKEVPIEQFKKLLNNHIQLLEFYRNLCNRFEELQKVFEEFDGVKS